jgi:hypothetical protein
MAQDRRKANKAISPYHISIQRDAEGLPVSMTFTPKTEGEIMEQRKQAEAAKAADQIMSIIFRVSRQAGLDVTREIIVEAMKRAEAPPEEEKQENTKDRGQKLDAPTAPAEPEAEPDEIV